MAETQMDVCEELELGDSILRVTTGIGSIVSGVLFLAGMAITISISRSGSFAILPAIAFTAGSLIVLVVCFSNYRRSSS